MATRYRFTATTTAPAVSPATQSYSHSSAARRILQLTDASALNNTAYSPDAADHLVAGDAMHVQFVSDELAAGVVFTSGDVLKLAVQCSEAHANNNVSLQVCVAVFDSTGATQRALIRSKVSEGTEMATTVTNRFLSTTLDASYTTVTGDRLVVELSNTGTPGPAAGGVQGHNAVIRYGGNGAGGDLPENDTEAGTTFNPWIEFADPTGNTGTIAVTQAADTAAIVGTQTFTGTVGASQAAQTSAITGSVANPISGTVAATQADQTMAAAGLLTITGTFASTQANQTSTASGTVANPITGTLAATQTDQTGVLAGTETMSGTLGATQDGNTAAISGSIANQNTGTLAAVQADNTAVVMGTIVSDGTLNAIQADQTAAISGLITNPVTGTMAATQAGNVGAFVGVETITGTLGATQAAQTMAGSGITAAGIVGTITVTQMGDTIAMGGTVQGVVTGTLAAVQAGDTATFSGAHIGPTTGTLAVDQQNQTMTAAGAVANPVAGAVVTVTCTLGGPTAVGVLGGPTVGCTISPMTIIAGSNAIVTATFRDANGDLANPSAVTAVVQAPDGTQTTPTPTSSTLGIWTTVIPTDQAGYWFWQISGAGNQIDVVCVGSFCAEPSLVLV